MLLAPFRRPLTGDLHVDHGRIYLRPPRQRDWRSWSELRQQSREFLMPWEPTWAHDALSRSAFRRRIRIYGQEWRQGTSYSFVILRREDEALLGGVTLSNIRRGVAQSGSLGYWIGQPFARRGYMTEALHGLIGFAFDELELHRIEAACLPSNLASRAVLERIGFSEEGFAREFLRINGSWQDHSLFAMLKNDPRRSGSPESKLSR